MGKFYGAIGYANTTEGNPGVWTEEITERNYYGDEFKVSRKLQTRDSLNDDVIVDNVISVLADPYAYEHFQNIRYVKWMGTAWKVNRVDVQRPRLSLYLGGVYNG